MRPYPTDSPQAAARIVALAVLADGRPDADPQSQLASLVEKDPLGLGREGWQAVIDGFHDDLQASPRQTWGDACRIDPLSLQHVLAEVADPGLRARALTLCLAAAEADAEISDGEALVLAAAVEQWGMQAQMMRATAPA